MKTVKLFVAMFVVVLVGCPKLVPKSHLPFLLSSVQALAAARKDYAQANPGCASESMGQLVPFLRNWNAQDLEEQLKVIAADIVFVRVSINDGDPDFWLVIRKRLYRLPNGAVRETPSAEAVSFVYAISSRGDIVETEDLRVFAMVKL